MDINRIIAECTTYDFKVEVEHKKSRNWLKSISAFANGVGGSLFFGIDDNRNVVGIADVQLESEYLSETIKTKIDPIQNFILQPDMIDGKNIIEVKVSAGNSTPYYLYSEGSRVAYIRVGNESIIAPNDRLLSLVLKGNNSTFDSVATNSRIEDFTFLNLANEYKKRTGSDFDRKYLDSFGLVTRKGFLTNAGLLLTDYCPVYQSRIFCTVWNGTEKLDAINDAEYSGNLLQLLEFGLSFIKASTKNGWVKMPNGRINYPDYSERAILECLVNHLIHRDYTVIGSEVHIDIFEDRITFTSPGGMYDGSLIQNCDINNVPSYRRNPIIADVFAHLDLMEKRGSGLRKICEETANLQTYTADKKPNFYSAGMSFVTTVMNVNFHSYAPSTGIVNAAVANTEGDQKSSQESNQKTNQKKLSESAEFVLRLITEDNYITIGELMIRTGLSQSGVKKNLSILKEKNLLKRVGADKGGHWEVIKINY